MKAHKRIRHLFIFLALGVSCQKSKNHEHHSEYPTGDDQATGSGLPEGCSLSFSAYPNSVYLNNLFRTAGRNFGKLDKNASLEARLSLLHACKAELEALKKNSIQPN